MLSGIQKKEFNKLKHDLENYRELILLANSILKWDKKFYPGIVFGLISTFYLFLWYLDLSVLTLISLGLLFLTIFDYTFPLVSKCIFKPDNWTGAQENKFEEVCNELCSAKIKLCSYYNSLFSVKEERSAVFLISMSLILIILAWIGSVIDNLLLSYFTSVIVSLWPGLQHHGFVGTVKQQFGTILSSKLQQLKEKANKKD